MRSFFKFIKYSDKIFWPYALEKSPNRIDQNSIPPGQRCLEIGISNMNKE